MMKQLLDIFDFSNEASRKAQVWAIGIILMLAVPSIALPVAIVSSAFILGRAYCDK